MTTERVVPELLFATPLLHMELNGQLYPNKGEVLEAVQLSHETCHHLHSDTVHYLYLDSNGVSDRQNCSQDSLGA